MKPASRALWGVVRGVRGVRGQQRRVGLGPLERRDAGTEASKLRCDEGLGGETQQGICYLGVYLQRRVQPVHRGEQGGQRACVRLAGKGGVVRANFAGAARLPQQEDAEGERAAHEFGEPRGPRRHGVRPEPSSGF